MVKGSVAVALLVLTLAGGIPDAHGALNISDNCATADAAVWTGWIYGERRDTLSDPSRSITHAYTTSIHIRLREIKEPDRVHIIKSDRSAKYGIRYVGCQIKLKVEASEIRTGYNGSCSNHTTSTYTDANKDGSGWIEYKTSNEPLRVSEQDIPPEGVYMLTFAPPGYWSPCNDRFPEVAYRLGNSPLRIGTNRFYGSRATDQQLADDYGDPKLRLLSEKHTRMTGSYSYTVNQNTTSMKVMWDICREGNKNCAGMPGSAPPTAPAPTTAQAPPQVNGCGDGKQGLLFLNPYTSGPLRVFAGPSTGSPVAGTLPRGGRVVFRQTVVQSGAVTWYHVWYQVYLGAAEGWVRAEDISCYRPPDHLRPMLPLEDIQRSARGVSAQTSACRG